ncbi:DUF3307 domain-containing protein [Cyclobacterium jeungdonense]|uniref:DUF3307 domain-containing protein n=1 Tax=Cyclobacterium jeungdonense TaxID=708087 RepID=A0ABT8CEY6_9BACT|nr:DUF3307 domain-containing protein [Cyclobacterium jeungdonense]MDN3690285.1 DUF3307 domain-containing protein [Cyclobacterium jeungdonense]
MILLTKLILAHLLGDFLLQPGSWVKAKETKKLRAIPLYLHLLVHGILILVLVADLEFWPYLLAIVLGHGIIDMVKIQAQKPGTRRYWFFVDQGAHLITLLLAVGLYDSSLIPEVSFSEKYWLLTTLGVFLTLPSSVIIQTIISKWTPLSDDTESSLDKAGQYIGIMERLFVFAFILSGRWEAIGFLVAAKSVFRFGDLRQSKDRKLTEYILIGTLLSFGLAIVCGLLYDQWQLIYP